MQFNLNVDTCLFLRTFKITGITLLRSACFFHVQQQYRAGLVPQRVAYHNCSTRPVFEVKVLHDFHQAPTPTPRLLLGVSGGTIPASSPASRPAATCQLKPAPPSHSETCSVTLNTLCRLVSTGLGGIIRPVLTFI